jgi:hypothetical protein
MRATRPNERLRRAMDLAGYGVESLAAATGFHPKQVGRWVAEGVVPRRVGAKAKVAQVLHVHEDDIWPRRIDGRQQPAAVTAEVVEVWAHRADVPKHRWWDLLADAKTDIDLLGWALVFLREDHPRLDRLLGDKVAAGCRVRIVVADPASRLVQDRDEEELLHGTLSWRIQQSLESLRQVPSLRGVELRTHHKRHPLYTSLFRADDQMFSTPHLFGVPGWAAPLYYVRRRHDDGLFDTLLDHFERIWDAADPVENRWRWMASASSSGRRF